MRLRYDLDRPETTKPSHGSTYSILAIHICKELLLKPPPRYILEGGPVSLLGIQKFYFQNFEGPGGPVRSGPWGETLILFCDMSMARKKFLIPGLSGLSRHLPGSGPGCLKGRIETFEQVLQALHFVLQTLLESLERSDLTANSIIVRKQPSALLSPVPGVCPDTDRVPVTLGSSPCNREGPGDLLLDSPSCIPQRRHLNRKVLDLLSNSLETVKDLLLAQ